MSCDRKIGPFPCCSVVQGDCLELLKLLPDGSVDAVITDPPYGIGFDTDYTRFTVGPRADGFGYEHLNRSHAAIHGDEEAFNPSPWLAFGNCILFGANHFAQSLPRGTWLIWDKRSSGPSFLSDAEVAWMKGGAGTYIFSHCWQGFSRASEMKQHYHPTQKPVALMTWCIEKAGNPGTILDPFAGSGTTLVAAKKLGRHFLGFEISPEYCEIARKRIALVEAQPNLIRA
jgi:site-specific DNA-methyltransferase (adenine-specific)